MQNIFVNCSLVTKWSILKKTVRPRYRRSFKAHSKRDGCALGVVVWQFLKNGIRELPRSRSRHRFEDLSSSQEENLLSAAVPPKRGLQRTFG